MSKVNQERIDKFKDLVSKAEDKGEWFITINLDVFNDFISDHEALIKENAELYDKLMERESEIREFIAENAKLKNKLAIKSLRKHEAN